MVLCLILDHQEAMGANGLHQGMADVLDAKRKFTPLGSATGQFDLALSELDRTPPSHRQSIFESNDGVLPFHPGPTLPAPNLEGLGLDQVFFVKVKGTTQAPRSSLWGCSVVDSLYSQ